MLKAFRRLPLVAVSALGALLLFGCSGRPTEDSDSTSGDSAVQEDESSTAGLGELSAADRAAALKQGVCPVSNQNLGSMGKPLKMSVEGRDVFLCCPACEDELRQNPEKHLAQLNSE